MFEVDEADLERVTAELQSQGKAEKLKSWCTLEVPEEQVQDKDPAKGAALR